MTIEINDLTFKCIIGILDFERVKKQRVIINLSFDYIFSDDIFIDYSEITKFIKTNMKEKKFLLIEDAIIFFESNLYEIYNITNLKIKITKPDILKKVKVSVSN